ANIERAVGHGGDLHARREMMAAAMNGALAFQKGLGSVHAMSHALGGLSEPGRHHGALNAVLLPHALAFNAPAVQHRYAALTEAMGLGPGEDLAEAIDALRARLGLPGSLGAMGVVRADVEVAAPLAEEDHANRTNPRRATASDYRAMMLAA